MEEKRSSTRFKINQLVICTPEGDEFHRAEGIDLSRGGLKCASSQSVETMSAVFIMLKLPGPEGERQVRCEGYVSHSQMVEGRCVFGVKFSSIDPDDKAVFEAYIASLEAGGAGLA
jgi:hypothetical protein